MTRIQSGCAALALAAAAGLAAPAFAGTLTPLASFGSGGWRAPRAILVGDSAGSNNRTNYN